MHFKMDLRTWCIKNNKQDMIAEWKGLLSDSFNIKTSMDKVAYDCNYNAVWDCQICGRTTYLTIGQRKIQEGKLNCRGCIEREKLKVRAEKRNKGERNEKNMVRSIHSSLPEQYIYYYLKQENLKIIREAKFDWLGKSSLDLYFPELSLAIEYDGSYWHYNGIDKDKTKICLEHGINIIRIREGAIPIRDKSKLIILYKENRNYSNIDMPILQIIDYLNETYNLMLKYPDVDIQRDKEKIVQFIAEQAKKTTIAYKWPEIYEYWDYEKNEDISPEDVVKSSNLFFWLKCPYCGENYQMKPKYYVHSMKECACEQTIEAKRKYYSYLKDYYDKHGNLDIKDRSLLARRSLDWIETIVEFRLYRNIPYDEIQDLRKLGLNIDYEENADYIYPLFRNRTEEEQKKYDEYFRHIDDDL